MELRGHQTPVRVTVMSVITGCTESRPATRYSCMTPLRLLTVKMVRGCPWFTLLSSLAAGRPFHLTQPLCALELV